MKLGKLSKRLRKELFANPKQAAVLGVVCLVAIWFWMPLLWKSSARKPATTKTIAAGSNDAPAANEVTAVSAKEEPKFTWMQLQAWRQSDRLIGSATLPADSREIFRSPKQIAAATTLAESNDNEEGLHNNQAAEQPVEMEKPTLVLESIVYGGTRRRALINGQTVKENDEFNLGEKNSGDEASTLKIMGRVTSITPSEVVVEVAGRTLRLKLQPKLLNRGGVIERTKVVNQLN